MKLLKIALLLALSTNALSANGINSNNATFETKILKTSNGGDGSALAGKPSCTDVLLACDRAVKALEKENAVLKDLNSIRAEEIQRLRLKDDTWVRNRALWLGAGLLIGIVGGVYIAK